MALNSGPCLLSNASSLRHPSVWTSIGVHPCSFGWPCIRRIGLIWGPKQPRLRLGYLHNPKSIVSHIHPFGRRHSKAGDGAEVSMWVPFHRLCNGATGFFLGIALLFSDGHLEYACPAVALSAERRVIGEFNKNQPGFEVENGDPMQERRVKLGHRLAQGWDFGKGHDPRSSELENWDPNLQRRVDLEHILAQALDSGNGHNPQNSELERGDPNEQRELDLERRLVQSLGVGNRHNLRHTRYFDGEPREIRSGMVLRTRKETRPLLQVRRGDVHEGFRESSANSYGQIVQGRNDMAERRSMFTEDAWLGMNRLKQYGELVERLETEEKMCTECTRNRRLLEQVWQTVSNEYYDQNGSFSQSKWSGELYDSLSKAGGLLRSRAQTYATVKEMVRSLGDRYSAFLSPGQYRIAIRRPIPSEIKYLAFQYTGIGIELGKSSSRGGLLVVAPFAGSPAEEAGILAGDRLLRVDDTPVDSLSADEAVALLRGPISSMVELEVSGAEPGSPVRIVLLERRALPLPPLRMRMVEARDGQVLAYLRLHYFTHEGTKNMAAAIREGEALGVDGYILDLRNNPGGVFEEAIAMAALWLDCDGCDVAETVRSSDSDVEDLVYSVNNLPKEIFKRHPGTLTHAPLAIITNRSSASASEVITGALHDNKRAITIGEKTFGKGVIQYFFPMDDGSGLKLTVAKYLTPSRYDISRQGGLIPDSACSDYPHERGQSDKCIEEAVSMLATMRDDRPSTPLPAPLPYRWLPLSERRQWASGSY